VEAPDLTTVKDFFRFYAATGKGRITKRVTCDSLIAVAEWFFACFTRVTNTQTNEDDRSEVYQWATESWRRRTSCMDAAVVRVFI
jgi:hypothetical protein